MSSTYTFHGLDAMERQLSQMIEQQYPAEFKRMVIQIASELQGKVKEKTPVKTSRLKDMWKVGRIKKQGDDYVIEVYNNMEYAEPVEYGHRKRGGNGFVQGAHMMELSLSELNDRLPVYMKNWIDNFIATHDLV